MKRYIRASISESTPDWLKKRLTSNSYNPFRTKFVKRGIALDRATYTSEPTSSDDIPIYLLQVDYGQTIYAPGINDDATESINGRYRKLGSIAKSKLPNMAVDVVYLNVNDPANRAPMKERYQDPRYTYRYDPRGKYAGQYMERDYDYETHEYHDTGWSKQGMTPSNETRARDKSGYKIPSPEEKLSEYYEKYPEKVRSKVDSLYDQLIEVRQMLIDSDFNSPLDDRFYRDNIGSAYRLFSDAVYDYRKLLTDISDNVSMHDIFYSRGNFGRSVAEIKSQIRKIKDTLSAQ